MVRKPLIAAGALVLAMFSAALVHAEPRVELEICAEEGFPVADMRPWSDLMGELGLVNSRIRGAKGADSPAIQTLTSGGETVGYHVVGILTRDGVLRVPKASFRVADKGRLAAWIAKLKDGGEEGVTVKPAAFGLLPRQLVQVHEALRVPVEFSTKDKLPRDAARQIAGGLALKFITDAAGQRALAADEPILDELQGLSSGTALAAILRPLGLVLVPEKDGTGLRLRIADSAAVAESWPVGWPPKGNPHETLPELFKFLNVEIADTSLGEALPAIGSRVKAPLVIDYNALARLDVDLATKKVSIPKTNTFYGKILDRILFQAALKYEVRVDEADKPLIWISGTR
ncbi:MAG: hypothetical protein SFU86_15885 [Pirellulaceae bacterium]|nr:hypothetical protein [Pirellulaceae bacterium]